MRGETKQQLKELREHAMPILHLITAMQGKWQSRDEPIIRELRTCDLVFGFDTNAPEHLGTLFFGRELLARVISRDPFFVPKAKTLSLTLDFRTEQLEMLCAILSVLKGRHDYRPHDPLTGDDDHE